MRRTHDWAVRCMAEHRRLTAAHPDRQPRRRCSAWCRAPSTKTCAGRPPADCVSIVGDDGRGFDGYGIGGALEKQNLATIVGWVTSELPEDKPRHLLGISEPDDLFAAVAAGADTFDCVSPSRVARNAAVYSATGRYNITGARYRRDFTPIDADCDCYTCGHYTRAYSTTCSRPRRCWPRRCAPSTTSASSSGWSTRSAPPSGPASSTNCARTFWAGTTQS